MLPPSPKSVTHPEPGHPADFFPPPAAADNRSRLARIDQPTIPMMVTGSISWTRLSVGFATLGWLVPGVLALESGRNSYREQLNAQEHTNPAATLLEPSDLDLLQTPIRGIAPTPSAIKRYLAAARRLIATLQRGAGGGTSELRIPAKVFYHTPNFADREPLPIAQVLASSLAAAPWNDASECINHYAELEVLSKVVQVYRQLKGRRSNSACFHLPHSSDPPREASRRALVLQKSQAQVLQMFERLAVTCTLTERTDPSQLGLFAKNISDKVLADLAELTKASQQLFQAYADGKLHEEDAFRAVPISLLSNTGSSQFSVLLERLYSVMIKISARLERATKEDHSFLTVAGHEAHVSILYGLRGRQLGAADYLVNNCLQKLLMQKLLYPTDLPAIPKCSPATQWPALNEFVGSRDPTTVTESNFLHFRTDLDDLCERLKAHQPSLLAPIYAVRLEGIPLAPEVLAIFGKIFNRLLAWESFLHALLAAIAHVEDRPKQLIFCISTLSAKPGLTVILDLLWIILEDQELLSGSTLLRQMPSIMGLNLGGPAGGH